MNVIPILADAEDVLIIIGIIIAVLVSLAKKGAAKAKEAQQQPARQQDQHQDRQPSHPQRTAGNERIAALRRTLENLGIVLEEERPAPPPVPPPLPQAAPAPAALKQDLAQRMDAELLHQQQRQAKAQSDRRRKMTRRHVPEEDTAAIEQRRGHLKSHPQATGRSRSAWTDLLGSRDSARRAIILHEILSPPKSIRQDRESWE